MVCPQCRKPVPDESVFCLSCGARLPRAERLTPNDGGAATTGSAVPAEKAAPTPGGKQAYALSFRALPDERLRYRVARWVCEVAPAHEFTEVQDALTRGEFATFLALTAEEAEAARHRIQALGVHAAALRLTPASPADLLLPSRPVTAKNGSRWTTGQKFLAVGIIVAILFVFGAAALYFYRSSTVVEPQPGRVPTIGGKP